MKKGCRLLWHALDAFPLKQVVRQVAEWRSI